MMCVKQGEVVASEAGRLVLRRRLHPEHLRPKKKKKNTAPKEKKKNLELLQVIQIGDSSPDRHCRQPVDGC